MRTSYIGSNNNAIMNRLHDQYAESFVIFQVYNATVVAPAMSASELNSTQVRQPFMLNTVALRWIRDCHERPRGFPTHGSVELTRRDPLPVGVLDDDSTGMQYKFKEDARQNWSWKQMLSSLDAKSQKCILGLPWTIYVIPPPIHPPRATE